MGRARVNSHLGGGLYDVVYWRDVERARLELETLDKRRKEIEVLRYGPSGSVAKKEAARQALAYAQQAALNAIDDWAECAKINCANESQLKKEVENLTRVKSQKAADYAGYVALDATLNAESMSILSKISHLQSTATDKEYQSMQLWCVDYPHEDYGPIPPGTVVGTIESYGATATTRGQQDLELPDPHINIQPSYQSEAAYTEARDHIQRPLGSMSTTEAVMNTLQFLYVANQNPSYCVGTLTSKDDVTSKGTVIIDGVTPVSRAPEEFVQKTLSNVPIIYQECHSRVFEVGDKVVVKFGAEKFGSPTIIGFAQNPKECSLLTLTYTTDAGAYIDGPTPQSVVKGSDGTEVRVAITDANKGFVSWSDGAPFKLVRKDANVQANITANANLVGGISWPTTIEMQIHEDYTSPYSGANWGGGYGAGTGSTTTQTPDGGFDSIIIAPNCNPYTTTVTFQLTASAWYMTGTTQGQFYVDGYTIPQAEPYVYGYILIEPLVSVLKNGWADSYFTGTVQGINYSLWGGTTVSYTEMDVVCSKIDCTSPWSFPQQQMDGTNSSHPVPFQDLFNYLEPHIPDVVECVHGATGARRLYYRNPTPGAQFNGGFYMDYHINPV